jgi:hypothetical protein
MHRECGHIRARFTLALFLIATVVLNQRVAVAQQVSPAEPASEHHTQKQEQSSKKGLKLLLAGLAVSAVGTYAMVYAKQHPRHYVEDVCNWDNISCHVYGGWGLTLEYDDTNRALFWTGATVAGVGGILTLLGADRWNDERSRAAGGLGVDLVPTAHYGAVARVTYRW